METRITGAREIIGIFYRTRVDLDLVDLDIIFAVDNVRQNHLNKRYNMNAQSNKSDKELNTKPQLAEEIWKGKITDMLAKLKNNKKKYVS